METGPKSYLPNHRPNSATVTEWASAIFEAGLSALGIPGGALLNTAIRKLIEKRIREAQVVLIEELQKGDLRVLSDPEVEEFVPIAFRFFTAARDGETTHILRTLARIVRGQANDGELRSDVFLRASQQLAGLSEKELALIAEYGRGGVAMRAKEDLSGLRRAPLKRHIMKKLIPSVFTNENEFHASCSLLVGRGLLTTYVVQNIDDLTIDFEVTADIERLRKLALEEVHQQETPR